jgi:hypothetical protein
MRRIKLQRSRNLPESAEAGVVAAAAGESEFHVSRKIIHFPSLRWNTVMYFPAFTAAPDLSVVW